MEPRESKSDKHFVASMFKSILRIAASVIFIITPIPEMKIAGFLMLVAEVFGIIEEM